jgi:hypothetical protein
MKFRNAFIALTVMALFAGLASAQLQQLAPINCSVSAAQSPNIRSEGITEKVGDIYIVCGTSGTVATSGPITRGNLLVDFGTPVTSKALGLANNIGAASEILLLINDPGANNGPVTGYGQNAAISFCSTVQSQADVALEIAGNGSLAAGTNCPTTLVSKPNSAGTQTYWELDNGSGTTTAANAYQGGIGGTKTGVTGVTWTANQVMFFNVPIYPSFNSSQTNTFRIVNVRVTPGANATITASITPSVLVSANGGYPPGSTYNYVMTGTPQVATASTGLTTTMNGVLGVSLCNPTALIPLPNQSKANLALLTFKENFSGAFKTAYLPIDPTGLSTNATGVPAAPAMASTTETYVVGSSTLSAAYAEAGFLGGTVGTVATGIPNSGTRLQAIFKNLDPNVVYYVSTGPVTDFQTYTAPTFTPGDGKSTPWAVLIGGSTTGTYAPVASSGTANSVVPVAVVAQTKQTDGTYTGTAVWEITNTVQGTPQTMTFGLYGVFNLNTGTTPTIGNAATVQLGYAPTTTSTLTNIPRFAAPSMAATKFDNILPCQTSLLFPYVVGVAGYNTGLAIANASADPYGTANSTGTCSLAFYSSTTPATYVTPTVAPGTSYTALLNTTNLLSDSVGAATLTNFNGAGYMFATCNFQYAHGFAFIDKGDGTPNAMAMGYVAQVVNSSTRGITLAGESLGQ